MYWRFFVDSRPASLDTTWKWALCRENHTILKAAEKSFATLTECMRDAAQHGYRGWDSEAEERSHGDDETMVAGMAIPRSCFIVGNQRVH